MATIYSSECPFELWAPNDRSHIHNTAFTLYAMSKTYEEESESDDEYDDED